MDYGETGYKQANNEGDEIRTLVMIQQQEEMYGERDFPYGNFDNAGIMHLLVGSDAENNQNNNDNNRKKKYTRHTAYQIQQLEAVFRVCPHPDEQLRTELSQRLGLNLKQIKFWFQNKRTQTKAQTEHNTNILLKEENDRLRQENAALKAVLTHSMCHNCRSSLSPFSLKGKTPIAENAHLKECHSAQASAAAGNLNAGQPSPSIGLPPMNKKISMPGAPGGSGSNLPVMVEATVSYNNNNVTGNVPPVLGLPARSNGNNNMTGGTMVHNESRGSLMLEHAVKAMDQLLRMAEPSNIFLWIKDGDSEVLNFEEYVQTFPPVLSASASTFAREASRETGVVISPSQALVDIFMDSERWMKMFPSLISAASAIQVISPGIDGTKNGTVQLMEAELQVLSPMVPLCKLKFLRYCKQFAIGQWAVVDVSADSFSGIHTEPPYLPFRQFPSGCIIQEFPNGCSRVIWIGHYEYDETAVAPLYRSLLRTGLGFGSVVWLERLKRQCKCISFFMQTAHAPQGLQQWIPFMNNRGLVYLAQRMSDSFCYGVCGSQYQWGNIQNGAIGNNYVFIKSRMSIDQPGEPSGVVLSATTSFWLPVNRDDLFHYLRNVNLRYQWDTLGQDAGFCTLLNVNKGPNDNDDDNAISIFRANNMTPENMVMMLQDTWSDDSASLVVHAPLQTSDVQSVLEGGDSTSVSILPSGFAIYSDPQVTQPSGFMSNHNFTNLGLPIMGNVHETDGTLLTVGYQVLVNSNPLKVVDEETIHILNSLIIRTSNRIREAMGCA